LKNVIKKSRSILSIALVLTIALSQVFSLTGSFFNVKADPVKTLADLQALLEEADRVTEEAEEDPYLYLPSTYQRLLEAIENAQEVYDAGVEDGTELETVDIVGGPDDPNWEVKNPYDMEPGYTPKDQQIATFGANHMEFVPWGAQLVRCTYAAGQGRYGIGGQFGEIDFRYNRSENPLPLNFKNDSISLSIVSGLYPSLPEHAVKSFTIVLSFSENIPDISIPWMISGNDYATPNSNSVFEATINLADVLTKEYAKSYADLYLAPLDYKVNVEYIRIDQTIEYNGDVGLSFLINDFTLTYMKTDVADATAELQAAIDGLETVKETTLHDGAKIRTSGAQGLMFGTMVDSAIKNAYIASGYTPTVYGTVLLPADMIPAGGELTKETAKAVYKEFTANEYPNLSEYSVYLIGWTEESQMTREITARSYVVYQKGEEQIAVYSSNTVTRSVYTVAINIYNEESGNPPLEDNLENGRTAYNWLISGV
jgi:hypothetical protein